MYDIVIVGAGPAGLTAAIYARRSNKSVLVFDAKGYGGQILDATTIVNYPGIQSISGLEYAKSLFEQAKSFGTLFKFEKVIDVDKVDNEIIVKTEKSEVKAKALIIATGAKSRPLGIADENKFVGRGVSYCATCDGHFFKNKDVAVIGGENPALEFAIYLADICNKVYLIYKKSELGGEESLVDKVKNLDNIEIITNGSVEKINGDNLVQSIDVLVGEENRNIELSGIFVANGHMPENGNFAKLVDIDDNGYIIADENCKTKTPHVYVAGDNRAKYLRQLTTAVADGSNAATYACRELNKD